MKVLPIHAWQLKKGGKSHEICILFQTHPNTGWRRETGKFEIIRKKMKETYKTLFDPENVFYKSGNFI
jgi:hypothetical protein